jgi:MFS superfamily sulfate permease-like transporter
MLFARVESPEGQPRFWVRDQVPAGIQRQPGTWRMKVGSERLSPEAISLSGGGAVVGEIPEGLPGLRVPQFDWGIMPKLLPAAVIISLLGFMEAISISKAMAARTRQRLNPNQELIGQGLANIVGCMAQSYAVSGSFSRSAVNLQAGARTGLSNVFSSCIVMIVLLFLARWLYYLPHAVLASIIMMAVFGLLNVSGFAHAWRANRFDGAVSIISFVGTLAFAPHLEWGIFIGVALSIGAYLYRSMRPQVAELAPHPDGAMRDAKRLGLKKCRHVAVVRFEGPLNFASANYLESEILNRVSELPELKALLVVGNGISEIDASGEETLRDLVRSLRGAGYMVLFSGMPERVLDVLKRSRLYDFIGADQFFSTSDQAIAAIYLSTHKDTEEVGCPYREAMPRLLELSLHPDGSLRDAERHGLRKCRHIAIFRFDARLSLANMALLEQEILQGVADRPALRHVILVSHGISDVDQSGAEKLGDLVQRLRADGFAVSFSGLQDDVVDMLDRSHVTGILGRQNMYPTQTMAVAGVYARSHAGSSETDCPLRNLAPHLTELSVDDSGVLREAEQHGLRLCSRIGLLRFDGPLALYDKKAIQSEFISWAKKRSSVRNIVLLANMLDKLDSNEQSNLVALVKAVREAGYRVVLANLSGRAFEDLARSRFADLIAPGSTFPTDTLAISAIMVDAHAADPEEECPLLCLLPPLTELSLHPDGSLRDAHRHGLALCQRIAAVRFDGALNFATINYFEKKLRDVLTRRPSVTHILLAGHTITGLDSIAADKLHELAARLRSDGYSVSVSGLKDDDLETLGLAGDTNAGDFDGVFPTQAVAIAKIHAQAHQDSGEMVCPLVGVVPSGGSASNDAECPPGEDRRSH